MSDTPEHVKFVDGACAAFFDDVIWVNIGTRRVTLGEISALAGDFYASPEDLRRDIVHAEEFLVRYRPEFKVEDELPAREALWFRGEHFVQLAVDNQRHFVRGSPGARTACSSYHQRAIEARADASGPANLAARDHCLLEEGFALHFLVDMFAAGHMLAPRHLAEKYLLNPGDKMPGGPYKPPNAKRVAALLSLAEHDRANAAGLWCSWYGPSSYTRLLADFKAFDPIRAPHILPNPTGLYGAASSTSARAKKPLFQQQTGRYTGDNFRFNLADPSVDHMSRTIAAHILDAWPWLLKNGVLYDPLPCAYSEFLHRALPVPLERGLDIRKLGEPQLGQPELIDDWDRPPYLIGSGDSSGPNLQWFGPANVAVLGEMVELGILTDPESKMIRKITVQARGDQGLILAGVAGASSPVFWPKQLYQTGHLLGPLDGNDDGVMDIFAALQKVGAIGSRAKAAWWLYDDSFQ